VDVDRSPAPLAALVPSYRPIFDRLLTVCEGDERIRALWLSGSLAQGTADGGSDLDCLLAIRDPDFDEFAARWREWLAAMTPTLLARELPLARGAFYSTTTGCERLDVVCEPVSNCLRHSSGTAKWSSTVTAWTPRSPLLTRGRDRTWTGSAGW
jgi:hypothetical protein